MSTFSENLKNQINNFSETENGAGGYATTGHHILDITFAVSSLRNASEQDIINQFNLAYDENRGLALKWLFFVRDIRGGLGERRLFRVIWNHLVQTSPEIATELVEYIPRYGRWDDIFNDFDSEKIYDVSYLDEVRDILINQFCEDYRNATLGKEISLLAKWLPSVNASSKVTREKASIIRRMFGLSEKEYRQSISKLRKYLKVVECDMSANNWDKIDYSRVPSKANLIYNNAFWKHDEERRMEFIDALEKGETKVNSSTNFPHDIVSKYAEHSTSDTILEELWKALPNLVPPNNNVLVVADGSGSMYTKIGDTNTTCLDVANGLAIYFAERSQGQFANQFITFSENPKLVDFSKCETLFDKLKLARRHNEVANTNIVKTFDLVLKTAIKNKLTQDELPTQLLIISDMEFDEGASIKGYLFDEIKNKFQRAGYKLPRLAFWNVGSRTNTIPIVENEYGFSLVSGFSPTVLKMVFSQELDPYKALVEILMQDRYAPIFYLEKSISPIDRSLASDETMNKSRELAKEIFS